MSRKKSIIVSAILVIFTIVVVAIVFSQQNLMAILPDTVADAQVEQRSPGSDKRLSLANQRLNSVLSAPFSKAVEDFGNGTYQVDEMASPSTINILGLDASCLSNELLQSSICLITKGEVEWILVDSVNTPDGSDMSQLSELLSQLGNPEQVRVMDRDYESNEPISYELAYPAFGYNIYASSHSDQAGTVYGIAMYEPAILAEYNKLVLDKYDNFGLLLLQN